MNRLRLLITFRAFLLFLVIALFCWLLLKTYFLYALLVFPVAAWILGLNFRSQLRAYRELEEFAEAARYRDFTRFFRCNMQALKSDLYVVHSMKSMGYSKK